MNYERVLVFGAHPDDEITMAAAMGKMACMGCEVTVAIYTDGCEGYPSPDMADSIVAMRKVEQAECDKVLGLKRRIHFDRPDMALVNDKDTFLDTIEVIRDVKPDAIFTHGPFDNHRDHLNTHAISVEARWQAGQPVAARLGEPWRPASRRPARARARASGLARRRCGGSFRRGSGSDCRTASGLKPLLQGAARAWAL